MNTEMQKWKGLYLGILTLVTVLSVIFGTIYHVGSAFKHAFRFIPFFWETTSDEWTEYEETYGDTDTITLDCALLNVEFEEGDEFAVYYEGSKRLQPEFSWKDGVLTVEQSDSQGKNTADKKWNDRVTDADLTIEIPESAVLDTVNLDVALGNVELDGVSAKTVIIEANLGNVEAEDLDAETVRINADLGNVELYEVKFTNLTADASMGNIIVESARRISDYVITANASLGNVEIEGRKVATNDSYKQSGKGDFTGTIQADASMGNVEIFTAD